MNPLKRKIKQEDLAQIATILTERKYASILVDLHKQQEELALSIYYYTYKGKLEQMNSLPDGWLPQVGFMTLQFVDSDGNIVNKSIVNATYRHSVYVKTSKQDATLRVSMGHLLPMTFQNYTGYTKVPHDLAAVTKYLDNKEVIADTQIELEAFNKQMHNVASGAGTWFKLYEVWAEVRPLIKHLEPTEKPKPLLPAIGTLSDLNASLGIPEAVA